MRKNLRVMLLLSCLSSAVWTACGRAEDPAEAPPPAEPAAAPAPGGGEASGSLPSCFELATPEAEQHLVRGWNGPEAKGRWTQQTGVVTLGTLPEGERATLVLQGASYRTDTPRVTVSLAQRQLLEAPVPPGPFRLTAPVDPLPGGPMEIEITSDPVFVPAENGIKDNRLLGVFLFSICLQPEGTPGAQ